ncbi:MAG TPA: hypothetical protein VLF87_01530 [Patescibacteria group bacterium]|nr:hypothetical protein [Patescibacteria group bacterium]
MKYTISPEDQFSTLEDTAEIMLTRRLIGAELGDGHEFTKHLSKLVRETIDAPGDFCVSFYGQENQMVISALHNCATAAEDTWPRAQARHMLRMAL